MKLLLFSSFLLFFSCDNNSSVRTYSIPKLKKNPIENKISNNDVFFNWTTPMHWEKGKPSSMRLASYNLPYDGGAGDLSVTNFGGDAGGELANVNRWRGQLNLLPITLENLNDDIYIGKSNLGEFKMFKIINNENEDSAFLCSIFDIGASTIFIKLVASVLGINQLENEFKEFCSSFYNQ